MNFSTTPTRGGDIQKLIGGSAPSTLDIQAVQFGWSVHNELYKACCRKGWLHHPIFKHGTPLLSHGHLTKPRKTISYPLRAILGRKSLSGASVPQRSRDFVDQPENHCPPRPTSQKTIALAFLKATSPQTPYWVHFISKVQNPIYMFTFIE